MNVIQFIYLGDIVLKYRVFVLMPLWECVCVHKMKDKNQKGGKRNGSCQTGYKKFAPEDKNSEWDLR